MDISKIITPQLTEAIKKTSKFELVIDKMILAMDKGGICPPKNELMQISVSKNQVTNALGSVSRVLGTLDKTASTANNIIGTINGAIITIKALPFPTSVPPGIGVPANVLTLLSDALDLLGKIVDKLEGPIKMVATTFKLVAELFDGIIKKLGILDALFDRCIKKEIKESIIWEPTKDYLIGDKVSWQEVYWDSLSSNKNKQPDTNPEDWSGVDETTALEESGGEIVAEINFSSSAEVGDFSPSSSLQNDGVDTSGNGNPGNNNEVTGAEQNQQAEIDLATALSTPPGVLVDPYYCMLEADNKETYAPSRAIVATHKDNPGDKLFNKFSFSATTQVLFNEMKFRIENLNSDIDFGYMTRVIEEDFVDNNNYGNTETTGSNSNTETPPPPPVWQPDGEKWRLFQDNFNTEGAYAYLQEGIDFGIGLSDKTLKEIFDILVPIAKEQFPAYDYLYPEEWPTLNYELNNESTSSP